MFWLMVFGGGLLAALIAGCGMSVLTACMLSSQIAREEEEYATQSKQSVS